MNLEDAVSPDLLSAVRQVRAFIEYMEEHPEELDAAKHHYDAIVSQHYEVLLRFENLYILNLLTPAGADYFLKVADDNAALFEVNTEEKPAYRIPELVLDYGLREPTLLAQKIGKEVLWPLFHLMYGAPPNHFSSIQLARYSAPDNLGTGWHSDEDSEASCVVSLSPERHTGGGTLIMPYGVFGSPLTIPPLRKGQALLFNGRTTLHRGLELDSGQRNLLVYWMKNTG